MTEADRTADPTQLERIKDEILDSFDEELETQLEEDRLDELAAAELSTPDSPSIDRQTYFRELFRLQHELVRLQDWVVPRGSRSWCCSKGAIRPARAAPSSASSRD
jgi:polyphosphate kinase 2 (PPK2 family)